MNTRKAIKILKKHGYSVGGGPKIWEVSRMGYHDDYTSRELVGLARCYTSDVKQPGVRELKAIAHGKNRAKTRELLHHEKYELFNKHKMANPDDLWNYD